MSRVLDFYLTAYEADNYEDLMSIYDGPDFADFDEDDDYDPYDDQDVD